MEQFHALLRRILKEGTWKNNRTGVRAIGIAGASVEYDCSDTYPLLTTKRVPFKSVVGELCGFLEGATSAARFRELGCNVWNQNANENKQWLANPFREGEDHLGPVYGAQWRKWQAFIDAKYLHRDQEKFLVATGWSPKEWENEDRGYKDIVGYSKEIDQIAECVKTIIQDPDNRRIIFHAWNPAELATMALVPCHLLYQFIPNSATGTLDLCMTQRSTDEFLGAPYNIASCAALLELVSHLTGFKPGKFVHHMNDCHIYENHLEQVEELLSREHRDQPTLVISPKVPTVKDGIDAVISYLDEVKPEDFILDGYDPHPALRAPMAV